MLSSRILFRDSGFCMYYNYSTLNFANIWFSSGIQYVHGNGPSLYNRHFWDKVCNKEVFSLWGKKNKPLFILILWRFLLLSLYNGEVAKASCYVFYTYISWSANIIWRQLKCTHLVDYINKSYQRRPSTSIFVCYLYIHKQTIRKYSVRVYSNYQLSISPIMGEGPDGTLDTHTFVFEAWYSLPVDY